MSAPAIDPVEPRSAASVLLLRPGRDGPEILFLQRNPALRFHGGSWVFPGGRIDPADHGVETPDDEESAARRAAVRETREEAGLTVAVEALVFAAHWTTPVESPIRFATWFFAAESPGDSVTVDGQEILAFRWRRPVDALREHAEGSLRMAAPTFVLTTRLAEFRSVGAALGAVAAWPPERLLGRLREVAGGRVVLYANDAAYPAGPLDRAGPRHRLWMVDGGWRYERSG